MSDYFDDFEKKNLQQLLWNELGTESGLDRPTFDECLDELLRKLQYPSPDYVAEAKAACASRGMPDRTVNLMWRMLCSQAQERAQFSLKGGAIVSVIGAVALAVSFFGASLSQSIQLPEWTQAWWIKAIFGVVLLYGVAQLFRGLSSLSSLRGIIEDTKSGKL